MSTSRQVSKFRFRTSIHVGVLSLTLGCDAPLPNPGSNQIDTGPQTRRGASPTVGASESTKGSADPVQPWSQPPAIGEPWMGWGIRPFNGTPQLASERQLAIAFGSRQPMETLVDLYRSRLETHGWGLQADWRDGNRRAISLTREDQRVCFLFASSEDSEPSLVLIEQPGPDARLGNCTEGSSLPHLKVSDFTPSPTEAPSNEPEPKPAPKSE